MPDYKFYATLLDAYDRYLLSESDNAEQEFIDKINRVPFVSEAASKGTALNDIIDAALLSGVSEGDGDIIVEKDGFEFDFDKDIIREISESLAMAIPQYHATGVVNTKYGQVEIYGYIDYLLLDKGIDLKGTGSFDIGKFKDSMQRHVYPVCLSQEGVFIDTFEFLVTDYKSIFRESYPVNLAESEQIIIEKCEGLIEFLQARRSVITDKKVFALDVAA